MTSFEFACHTWDVPRSECREFVVAGRRVLVCEYDGAYYAHSASCTHLEYSLDGSRVCQGAIECAWHRFQYDVKTGDNVSPVAMCPTGDPELSKPVAPLATYATEVRNNRIYVEVSSAPAYLSFGAVWD